MADITVEIKGIERLTRNLEETRRVAFTVLSRAMDFAHEEARRRVKPHPVDKGTLAEGMEKKITGDPIPLEATIYPHRSIAGISGTINYGRQAGKRPSAKAIGRWAKRHGIAVSPWVLARQIGQRGTEGIYWMEKTVEATRAKMDEFINDTVREIKRNWGR